jgi:hypothetical protein
LSWEPDCRGKRDEQQRYTRRSGGTGTRQAKATVFLFWALDYYCVWLGVSFLAPPPSLNDFGYVLVQIAFAALWYRLHTLRLRDAEFSGASARGVLAIYLLAVGLLLLVINFMEEPGRYFFGYSVMVIRQLVTFSRGDLDPVAYLALLACVALLVPPLFSVWAAAQPGRRA